MEYKNSGALFSVTVKKNPKQPDYRGDITLTLSDFKVENGKIRVNVAGWKREDRNEKTFLSLTCSQYEEYKKQTKEEKDDDFPF